MERAVFLGDSITAWNPRKDIVNYGVPGDTVRDIFWRIDDIKGEEESSVYLMAGVNDIIMGISEIKTLEYYKKVLVFLKNSYRRVSVVSVLPIAGEAEKNLKIMSLNKGISDLCMEIGVGYIDVHRGFTNEKGWLDYRYTTDGIHLSAGGYCLLNKEIEKDKEKDNR